MTREVTSLADLVAQVQALPVAEGRARRLVALAGAPGSGKSTLAELLVQALCANGTGAAVVPMDGFHLDNRLLSEMDLRDRKGAPESFDQAGFQRLIAAMAAEDEVIYPEFDRARDIAIAGAARVDAGVEVAVVEGNYLMFDAPGWRDLAALWDLSVRVDVPRGLLRDRLVARWQAYGLSDAEAEARAEGNDMVNADRVAAAALPADVIWKGETE
ncbi:nucleoside/nucleotide kinase family protein [Phaeobacter inhibens]|uniref:nucleoside/nucleotide kinase family protein n=1 Tax=Phaeobacter inhibens TaxID=221822 RepID=UPI0021A307FE|nr:nucleoside/nucleotide kinase family protein [Phaeobacter inhibens]UWR87759.1 nucleoside/nucleotide kinase family protein [Phaeobacter inhibens]